jgi:membrane-bound metal-dependent hydrolase YbcI (DUF457 family)
MHPYEKWPFLSEPHHPVLSAVWAVFAHGVLAVVVVLPLILISGRKLLVGALAFVASPALDLDHAVAAGSLSPHAMEHLSHRPGTHSLFLALALALLGFAFTRSRLVAWGVFAVIVSHLLFDAAGGDERWLYPLEHPSSIPWLLCPIGIVMLTCISAVLVRAAGQSAPSKRPAAVSSAGG